MNPRLSSIRRLALFVALALLGSAIATASAKDNTFKPWPAPSFSLKDRTGQIHSLADFKGRVVLVDFWASWCAPCKAEFPALDALHEELHADGLEVVAINLDENTKDALAFLAGRSPTMNVLFDPQGHSAEDFKVEGMPSSFLIDRLGNVRFQHMGFTAQTKSDFRREIGILLKEDVGHASR